MKQGMMLCVCFGMMGLLPSFALANDSAFGGSGAELVALKEKDLRMASEDIVIQKMAPGGKWKTDFWRINATYTFENPTKKEKQVTLGFPERFCDDGGDCNTQEESSKYTFWGMKTWVDGKRVKVRVGQTKSPKAWGLGIGQVHLFDVKIKAGQTITVKHQYEMGKSDSVMMDESITYVTKTGALWNGPIGSAKFTILVPQRPWGFHYPKDFKLKSYGPAGEGAMKGMTKIVFQMKNWTPKQDLDLLFGSSLPDLYGCPSVFLTLNQVDMKAPDIPKLAKRFGKLSKSQLKVCRNLPYARHGYSFKSKKLQKLFYGKKVSKPITKVPQSAWFFGSGFGKDYRVVTFAPNPSYNPEMLSPRERLWVKVVKHAEANLKKRSK